MALDYNRADLKDVMGLFAAMHDGGEAPAGTSASTVNGDGTRLPFPDDTFDRIIASEVMEHIPDDAAAAREPGPSSQAWRHPGGDGTHLAARADLLGPQ